MFAPIFRMTRFDYLNTKLTRPKLRSQREQLRRTPGAEAKHWAWDAGDGRGGIVSGITRSHARSAVKAKLGIAKKKRVPIGVSIVPIEG